VSGVLLDKDGPSLILTPATLCKQWQEQLKDKLGIPSGVWISNRKVWLDAEGHIVRTRGAEDIGRCPFQIGIVSTGLIFHEAQEAKVLLDRRYGTLILDEAHRARRARGPGPRSGEPNNLLKFMSKAACKAKHVLLGTATPIQTNVEELWDLLNILNMGSNHVMGRDFSQWKQCSNALPILTGERRVQEEMEGWNLIRNPLPPGREAALFDHVRSDLRIPKEQHFTDKPLTELDSHTRGELNDALCDVQDGMNFFQRNNPIVRHTVLRKRATLEDMGLLERVAVDIWPSRHENLAMFDGLGLKTSAEFDAAYGEAARFTEALSKRTRSAGFMKTMMQSRICSSIASGLSTAQKLLDKRMQTDEAEDETLMEMPEIVDVERFHLENIIKHLSSRPTDPKLDAVLLFLIDRNWLEMGCIIFSQYYDTAYWVAKSLTASLPQEQIALYAGAGKSGLFFNCEWRSVDRKDITKAIDTRSLRLIVATDAACEGLNLQTLGTLINVDLPWNPSRLEQRIGRIKRFGQSRDRVDMLNLVYHDTQDEKVYEVLSTRMKDRFDLFGSLPDTLEDEWMDDIKSLEERLREFTERKTRANAFDVRYGSTVNPKGPGWEMCEKVLGRRDIVKRLSEAW
jgi:superfamily II DNA or RNA helicase